MFPVVLPVVALRWRRNVAEKFTKFFRKVALCDEFQALGHIDRTIFCYLMTEYDGNNNGSIRCGHLHLKREYHLKGGPNSHRRALQRLGDAGLVFISRKGGRNLGPDLCALTMFNMDAPRKGERYPHPYKTDNRPMRRHWDKPIGNGNPLHKMLSSATSNVTAGRFGKS